MLLNPWFKRRRPYILSGLGAAALVLLAACLLSQQAISLAAPLVGEHNWRQADTYSIATNFRHSSANFFLPRIDMTRGRSGIMGMEAPLYPFVCSLFMRIFGDSAAICRSVTWVLGMLALGCCMVCFRRRGDRLMLGCWPWCVASSPLFLYEFRQVQPDAPMASLLAMSAGAFYKFSQTAKAGWYLAGLSGFGLAVLLKTPALISAFALWMFCWAEGRRTWRHLLKTAWPLVLPLAIGLGWLLWSKQLNRVYNAGEVYFATELSTAQVISNLQDTASLKRVWSALLPSYFCNWLLFPMFLSGLVVACAKEHRRLAWPMAAWLLSWLFFCSALSSKLWSHWYYAAPLVFPLAYFLCLGLCAALRALLAPQHAEQHGRFALWMLIGTVLLFSIVGGEPMPAEHTLGSSDARMAAGAGWLADDRVALLLGLLVAAILAAQLRLPKLAQAGLGLLLLVAGPAAAWRANAEAEKVLAWRSRKTTWHETDRWAATLRSTCNRYSDRGDLFVVNTHDNPIGLHWPLRKGFVEPAGRIDALGIDYYRQRGARFLLAYEAEGRPAAVNTLPSLVRHRSWELFCLDARGCPEKPSHAR